MNKLVSQRGETITEVLVALLVAALGMLLFVTMVIASGKIADRSDKAYSKYVNTRNIIESRDQGAGEMKSGKDTVDISRRTDDGNIMTGRTLTEPVLTYAAGDYFVYDPGK